MAQNDLKKFLGYAILIIVTPKTVIRYPNHTLQEYHQVNRSSILVTLQQKKGLTDDGFQVQS